VIRLVGHGMPRRGSRRGDMLVQVVIDTPQTLNPGETVRAVSIDDHRLYPVGGGGTWLTTLVADLAMIALLAVWAWRVPRWVWRRARRRRRERQRR